MSKLGVANVRCCPKLIVPLQTAIARGPGQYLFPPMGQPKAASVTIGAGRIGYDQSGPVFRGTRTSSHLGVRPGTCDR